MSVTFHLYKPVDAYRLPSKIDTISNGEYKKLIEKYPQNIDANDVFWDDMFKEAGWSDGKEHKEVNLSGLKCLAKHDKKSRLGKMLKRLHFPVQYMHHPDYTDKYIAVDEVLYRQGWFLKKSFFKKVNYTHIYTTKEEMMAFFKRYIDYQNADRRGAECVKTFSDAWQDGLLFVCSW